MKNKYFYLELMSSITKLRGIFERDRGASYSNEYEVNFSRFTEGALTKNLSTAGFTNFVGSETAFQNMMFLCDEASLPGTFAATQEIDGIFGGTMIQYPHGKLYNDLRLSFIQTNEMLPQKFFEAWFYSIFPERALNTKEEIAINSSGRETRSNVVTIQYYDEIVCNMSITKSFKDSSSYKGGKSMEYEIVNAYPYTIESVPLAYGASTLNKLRVSFRYEKHVAKFY
jgi:hypothetical protein